MRAATTWVNPDDPKDVRPIATENAIDAADRPYRIESPVGLARIRRDALGRPWRTTDPFGRVTERRYNSRGLVIESRTEREDEYGNLRWLVERTVYDAQGRPVVQTTPHVEGAADVRGTRVAYDAVGRVERVEERQGLIVDIGGNASDSEAVLTSAGLLIASQETRYDASGRVTGGTDQYQLETLNTFDSFGRLIEVRTQSLDEDGKRVWRVQRTVFDAYGRVSVTTDPFVEGSLSPVLGTRTNHDMHGRVVGIERLLGVDVTIAGGAAVLASPGTVISATRTEYDDSVRITRAVAADGGITDYEYDQLDRQTAVIGPFVVDRDTGDFVRHRIELEYDRYSRLRVERTNILQDVHGRIDASRAIESVHRYDDSGNLVETTFADGTTIARTYNDLGQVTSEKNQAGLTSTFEYDRDRLAAVVLPAVPDQRNGGRPRNPRYEYAYDEFGNQARVLDPLSRATRFEYDDDGHLLSRTLPSGLVESFRYDGRGRLVLHISFEGVVTEYVYNAVGQLAQKRFYDSPAAYADGAGVPAETVAYAYDAFGRLTSETSRRGTMRYTYDLEGRATRIESPEGAVNYRYDALGRRTRTFTGSESAPRDDTRYTFDSLGRLETATVWVRDGVLIPEPDREVTRYEYDLVGNLVSVIQPNGFISTYEYGKLGRIDRLTHYAPRTSPDSPTAGPRLAEYDYAISPGGKWDGVVETLWDGDERQVTRIDWT